MVVQAVQNEGKSTYDSDYNGEDPASRQDRVSTKETTYLEDEEVYAQDGYYKDDYQYEKDPKLVQVVEELVATKAKLAEQECISEKMKRMMIRLQTKFRDLGDLDEDALVLGGADAAAPSPATAGPSKVAPNSGKEKVGELERPKAPTPPTGMDHQAKWPPRAEGLWCS